PRAFFHHSPRFIGKKRGAGAPLRRIGPSVCLSFERRALRSAPARRFLGMGRAFREAKASPSASSSRRFLVTGGGAPCRPGSAAASRARGRQSRSHSKTPRETPLVDQDGGTIRPPKGLGIRNRENFFALKSFRNLSQGALSKQKPRQRRQVYAPCASLAAKAR